MLFRHNLSEHESKICNAGERLIPFVTDDLIELVRHKSSYCFFRRVIKLDIACGMVDKTIRIVDLGCGVGHGAYELSAIPGAEILGVDYSEESLEYARRYYSRDNIVFQLGDITQFISEMPEFDYVVSRNALEHIPDGLGLASTAKYRYRLLFDVPYDELAGNPHHILTGIRETDFLDFQNKELFFQDLAGVIYNEEQKPTKPNIIICICSGPSLQKVSASNITFPVPVWKGEGKDIEYEHLFRDYNDLLRDYHQLLEKHHQIEKKHNELLQSKAVVIAEEIGRHPFIHRLASFSYRYLAGAYRMLRRRR